jgi:hypothetical protein
LSSVCGRIPPWIGADKSIGCPNPRSGASATVGKEAVDSDSATAGKVLQKHSATNNPLRNMAHAPTADKTLWVGIPLHYVWSGKFR